MKVNVRFFAMARETVGASEQVQDVPEGTTLQELRDVLFQTYPGLRAQRLQFAVNLSYAPLTTMLHAGDEVACIPPVGGG